MATLHTVCASCFLYDVTVSVPLNNMATCCFVALSLTIESINLCDLPALVISPQ